MGEAQPLRSKMRVLVLGGTKFVGRAVAMEAISRGHDVTTFNRGTMSTPKGAKAISGDRLADDGYKGLDGLIFDMVVDTWSSDAVAVRAAIEALKGRVSHYIYISSVSVYDENTAVPPVSEESPAIDPEKSEVQYCIDKRNGELAVENAGVPFLIARPGLILGPYEDIQGRLPWWLGRLARGGRTLAPGPRDNGMQYIDARDLASFVIDAGEKGLSGVYNTISKPAHATMEEFLNTANKVAGCRSEFVWKDPESILAAGITPWIELPCWLPPGPERDFVFNCNVNKAFGAGLWARSVQNTIEDTWEWLQGQDERPPIHGRHGLDPAKEEALIH